MIAEYFAQKEYQYRVEQAERAIRRGAGAPARSTFRWPARLPFGRRRG